MLLADFTAGQNLVVGPAQVTAYVRNFGQLARDHRIGEGISMAAAATVQTSQQTAGEAAPGGGNRFSGALPLVVPAVLAAILGLWGIERQGSMWRDESVTWQVAHRPLGDLWSLLSHVDAVHGLYYLFMHGLFAIWDGGLLALRMPSVAGTVLAAAGVGAIGRRLAGVRAGVLSGSAYALLPIVQHFSQEGRSYALVAATVIWSCFQLLRCLDNSSIRQWVIYACLVALAGWLHEFAALVLLAHWVTLRFTNPPPRTKRSWIVAASAAVAVLVPLALVSAGQSGQQLGWLGRPSHAAWLQFFAISTSGVLLARYVGRTAALPVPARQCSVTIPALALPLLVLPGGLLMTVSLLKPWYVERYVLYSAAGLALLIGTALSAVSCSADWRSARVRITAGLMAVAGLSALLPWSLQTRSPESRKDDTVAVAQTIDEYARRGDAVLFMPARRREWLLSAPSVYTTVTDLALDRSPTASRTLQGTELSADIIGSRILQEDRVIAVADPPGQPLDPFAEEVVKREVLKDHFERCLSKQVLGAQISLYARPGHCV